ncbi:acyltransferase [Streptococcus mitis]|uniref:acyltransferase n=1 Tax=Streptococcus mitis TaxID=28037 RepID=UPI00200192D2|nr:DapH/DapD/GlmU-related protein [Streptococcus mitis]
MNIKRIVKIITGRDIEIHPDVPINYVMKKGIIYSLGLIKGVIRSIGFGKRGNRFFIGNGVSISAKHKLYIGNNVRIGHYVVIDALSENGVQLADYVKIGDYSQIIGTGSINNMGKGLSIGKNSSFSEFCLFGAAGGITIGDDVISGQNVRFHSENHNYDNIDKLIREQGVNRKGISVGNNCWIGAGAVFLDGSSIGSGCIVAANSVVTKHFPDNVIIGGVPAKILKKRS